ncbi:beta-defensin 132 [Zalophus californianus]|uniref:Beta-defensin n=1 Tax=Zalophus californianus TaxID=9704 RepID=A0A6P9FLV7_ZALCA|nr:beta-defensin 132 [Zalophus californianus]
MKLLLLVFASFGFLGTPASGGRARCTHKFPGRCKMSCNSLERSIFMCDRYKLCCVKDPLRTIVPPPVHKVQNHCRKTTKRQNEEHQMGIPPKPLSLPSIQHNYRTPIKR